jgi:hypothetical protein
MKRLAKFWTTFWGVSVMCFVFWGGSSGIPLLTIAVASLLFGLCAGVVAGAGENTSLPIKALVAALFVAYLLSPILVQQLMPRRYLLQPGDRIWHVYCLWINACDEDGHWRVQPFPDDGMPNYSSQVIGDEDVVYYDPASYQKALETGMDQDLPIKHLFLKDPESWILQEQPPDSGRELKH